MKAYDIYKITSPDYEDQWFSGGQVVVYETYQEEEAAKKRVAELNGARDRLIDAAAGIEDGELRRRLMDVLALMAVCDGELAEKERAFLTNIAGRLDVPLDLEEVEKRTRDYRVAVKQSMAGRAAGTVRDTATTTGRRAKGALGKVLKRRTVSNTDDETEES